MISQRINYEGVVNIARHMPQKHSIIATKTNNPDVLMFDTEKHPSEPVDNECNPEYRLKGHVEDGYGLSWSALKQGHLLSCTYDGEIGLWDINAKPENRSIDVCLLFKAHKGAVRDVAWHMKNEFMYGSVGVDKYLRKWDTRTKGDNSPAQFVLAHKLDVNSLSFNHIRDELIATGSKDKTVKIFDLRKLDTALHNFTKHEKEVLKVAWSPKNETVLASSCLGSKIMIWDLSRVGIEKLPQEVEGSTPELLTTHGHTEKDTILGVCCEMLIRLFNKKNNWGMTQNLKEQSSSFGETIDMDSVDDDFKSDIDNDSFREFEDLRKPQIMQNQSVMVNEQQQQMKK